MNSLTRLAKGIRSIPLGRDSSSVGNRNTRSLPGGLVQIDGKPIEIADNAIIVVSCIRNERLRLPFFLRYYRSLGVDRFLFIDNDSTDGSTPLLQSQPDVYLFHTNSSYAASKCGVNWLNTVLNTFADGLWALVVDADELLKYPGCESVGLRDLTLHLDRESGQAMQTFLLDMYGDGPIRNALYAQGDEFIGTCPYFDGDSYTWEERPRGIRVPGRGGARKRLFWDNAEESYGNPPYLPKVPLVKWRKGLEYKASTHIIDGISLAGVTGVLQHFKLFSDFAITAKAEAERKEHWDEGVQYSTYASVMAAHQDLNPMYGGSVRYEDSWQLVKLGFMRSTSAYDLLAADNNPA